ncbi:MAG: toll/interleukin-1 receptor domain-containing protein [Chloroflexi bacterium]|nr:toll/interleukin-1 receptor domain-containing protein [Chloroflexota bacterium]
MMAEKPTLFLSYRRKSSADLARYLNDHLNRMGVDVFFDVADIEGGTRWSAALERELINRRYFLVILAPDTLESEWVRKEIETALRHQKVIIPLLTQGFTFQDVTLPEAIKDLAEYQAVKFDYESPEPAFERIKQTLQIGRPRRLLKWIGGGALATIIALMLAFLALFPEQTRTEWFQALGLIGQSATPSTAATDAPRPTDTPAAPTDTRVPATPVPFVPTGAPFPTAAVSAVLTDAPTGEATLRLITSPDTLTIVVQASASVDLRGLNLRYEDSFGAVVTRHPADDFDVLALTRGMAEPGACFVYREAGSSSPLANACTNTQKVFRREVTRADVFWYDFTTNRPRDLVTLNGEQLIIVCPGSSPSCDVAYTGAALNP